MNNLENTQLGSRKFAKLSNSNILLFRTRIFNLLSLIPKVFIKKVWKQKIHEPKFRNRRKFLFSFWYYYRDKTFKLKYQYFRINQEYIFYFFNARASQGRGHCFFFLYYRTLTLTHKDYYFHINQRNSKKYFLPRASQLGRWDISFFFIFRDMTLKN